VDTVRALCELFAQVDVDGDQIMVWDEFTGFCIEAGLASGKFKVCSAMSMRGRTACSASRRACVLWRVTAAVAAEVAHVGAHGLCIAHVAHTALHPRRRDPPDQACGTWRSR
jgi:hypothetical protein